MRADESVEITDGLSCGNGRNIISATCDTTCAISIAALSGVRGTYILAIATGPGDAISIAGRSRRATSEQGGDDYYRNGYKTLNR